MKDTTNETNHAISDAQHEQWQSTFASRPEMFGGEPSHPARQTAARCEHEGRRTILELGCGQGRDALFFAGSGFQVAALDYSERGLQDLRAKAEQAGISSQLNTVCNDIRKPLPFNAGSFDVCFSHMMYCMALTIAELKTPLFGENFVFVADEAVTDSPPVFAGRERWQVWQKRKTKK